MKGVKYEILKRANLYYIETDGKKLLIDTGSTVNILFEDCDGGTISSIHSFSGQVMVVKKSVEFLGKKRPVFFSSALKPYKYLDGVVGLPILKTAKIDFIKNTLHVYG